MKKILVAINTLTSIDQPVYANHCQMWFRLGRNMPDCEFGFFTPRRSSIDRMRNQTADFAIAHNFDYVCFIDDDVLVPTNGLADLLKHDKDIIAGWTIVKIASFILNYNVFNNMIFKWDEMGTGLLKWDDFKETEGLLQVGAIGCSFALIKTDVFRRIPSPYFVTGPNNTEDIYFCVKCQKYIEGIELFVDLSVKTAHSLGPDYITPDNKKNFLAFYEANYPELVDTDRGDRGNEYLMKLKEITQEDVALASEN